MGERGGRALIISDGGLPSLLAAAMEAERALRDDGEGAALLALPQGLPGEAVRREAIARQARYFSMAESEPVSPPPRLDAAAPAGLGDTSRLVCALYTALAGGFGRVVWPVHLRCDDETIGDILPLLSAAADRALLIGRLAMLDNTEPDARELTIETPLLDLTDSQIADLVVDMDAPVALCWWGLLSAATVGEAGGERSLWSAALRDAGWSEPAPEALSSAIAGESARGPR